MHELSIASSLVEGVLAFVELHRVNKVLAIRLAVGELTCVETEQLRFCYTAVTRETAIATATLEIDQINALIRCSHCAYEGSPKYWQDALSGTAVPTLQCPECGRAAEPIQGHECLIKGIRYVP
jgi:hydrogenase nickel incorporation protein HypA/HybF